MSDNDRIACRWCGEKHGPRCLYVKEIEFQQDGVTPRRVVFFSQTDFHPIGGVTMEQLRAPCLPRFYGTMSSGSELPYPQLWM